MATTDRSESVLSRVFEHEFYRDQDVESIKAFIDRSGELAHAYETIQNQHSGDVANRQECGALIETVGASTLFILRPGTYTLGNDVTWSPDSYSRSAIVILADDVTLDLNGHTLTTHVSESGVQRATLAIVGCSGVTIRNGTLASPSYCGIFAADASQLSIEHVTIDGLTFTDPSSARTEPAATASRPIVYPAGISILGCKQSSINGVTVSNLSITASTGAAIVLALCHGGGIANTELTKLSNANGSMQGLTQYGCWDMAISETRVHHLTTDSIAGNPSGASTAIGFMPTASAELTFTNCESHHIHGCCDDCHGMSVFVCMGVRVHGFHAHDVVDGHLPYNKGAKATGLEVYGVDVEIMDCHVREIVAHNPEDLQSSGFSAWGAGIRFENCTAESVKIVSASDSSTRYFPVGFGWAPDPRPEFRHANATWVEYSKCTARHCHIGFDSFKHVDSRWVDVQAPDCSVSILKPPQEDRTLSCCPCSECNPPISVAVPDDAGGNRFPPDV